MRVDTKTGELIEENPSVLLFLESLGDEALRALAEGYEDILRLAGTGAPKASLTFKVKATKGPKPGQVDIESSVSIAQPVPKPFAHPSSVFVIEGRIVKNDPQKALPL